MTLVFVELHDLLVSMGFDGEPIEGGYYVMDLNAAECVTGLKGCGADVGALRRSLGESLVAAEGHEFFFLETGMTGVGECVCYCGMLGGMVALLGAFGLELLGYGPGQGSALFQDREARRTVSVPILEGSRVGSSVSQRWVPVHEALDALVLSGAVTGP